MSEGPLDQPSGGSHVGSVTQRKQKKYVKGWEFLSFLTGLGVLIISWSFEVGIRIYTHSLEPNNGKVRLIKTSKLTQLLPGVASHPILRYYIQINLFYLCTTYSHRCRILWFTNSYFIICACWRKHQLHVKNYVHVYMCRSMHTHTCILFI